MNMRRAVESVTIGHPHKVCDQIADALVDAFLRQDKRARLELQVIGGVGLIFVTGSVASYADFDVPALVQEVYKDIGYNDVPEVFAHLEPHLRVAPPVRGASQTVVVRGYATRETREQLPRPYVYARSLTRSLDRLRQHHPEFSWMQPDGYAQVFSSGKDIDTVVLHVSHSADIHEHDVQTALLDQLIRPVFGTSSESLRLHINPSGPWTLAGFKRMPGGSNQCRSMDLYGGLVPETNHGLSGLDPRRPERAGTYMARYIARYLVNEGLSDAALISIGYIQGESRPAFIDVQGSPGKMGKTNKCLAELISKQFDLHPEAIVERFQLEKPIYRSLAAYGHIGREELPWEEKPNTNNSIETLQNPESTRTKSPFSSESPLS